MRWVTVLLRRCEAGVIVVEGPATAAFHLVGGRRDIVAAQYLGDAAQGPEGILQTLLQGQEGLTGGDLRVAPPRVAENQLGQQMPVGLSGDGHLEFHAVGEVNLGLPYRRMHLGKVHLLIRTMQRPPPEPAEGPAIVVAGCGAGTR